MAQAEVQAEALAEIALANLVTKDDLKQAIDNLEYRLRAHLEAELRKQMLWFFTAQVALFGALAALIKLL